MVDREKLDELVAELVRESFGPSYRDYVFFYIINNNEVVIKVVGLYGVILSNDQVVQGSAVFTVRARLSNDKVVIEEVS